MVATAAKASMGTAASAQSRRIVSMGQARELSATRRTAAGSSVPGKWAPRRWPTTPHSASPCSAKSPRRRANHRRRRSGGRAHDRMARRRPRMRSCHRRKWGRTDLRDRWPVRSGAIVRKERSALAPTRRARRPDRAARQPSCRSLPRRCRANSCSRAGAEYRIHWRGPNESGTIALDKMRSTSCGSTAASSRARRAAIVSPSTVGTSGDAIRRTVALLKGSPA